MRCKIYVIIIIIGILVFGVYNIGVQSYMPIETLKFKSERLKVDVLQKDNYQSIINENQQIFEANIKVLKASKDWFNETIELLENEDLESIMFLYSNGVEKEISDLVYDVYLYSNSKNEKISKELEDSWDSFCDNFEYAYFNKSQSAEYKKYIKEAIENINLVIESIDSI